MKKIADTFNRLGPGLVIVALVGMIVASVVIYIADNADASAPCQIPSDLATIPNDEPDDLNGVEVEDKLLIKFGTAGGTETAFATFDLPSDELDGKALEAVPGLFTDPDDPAKRIPPERFTAAATVENSTVLVRLCANASEIKPGVYEGNVVVAGQVVIDAEVHYKNYMALLGLPAGVLLALVALSTIDNRKYTFWLFLIALFGAAVGWLVWMSSESLAGINDYLTMFGAVFAGASTTLLGVLAFLAKDPSSGVATQQTESGENESDG